MKKIAYIVIIFCFISMVQAVTLRDPTKLDALPWEAIDSGQDFAVSAILISQGRKVAIINKESFEEGGLVGGKKIISISPNEVKFKGEDEEFSRELHSSILEPVKNKEKE